MSEEILGIEPVVTGDTGERDSLAFTAQEYGQKLADAAAQARDFVGEKVSVVSGKLRDLQNKDFDEITSEAKDFARRNPGQAILISAAAGLVIGLLLGRGRR